MNDDNFNIAERTFGDAKFPILSDDTIYIPVKDYDTSKKDSVCSDILELSPNSTRETNSRRKNLTLTTMSPIYSDSLNDLASKSVKALGSDQQGSTGCCTGSHLHHKILPNDGKSANIYLGQLKPIVKSTNGTFFGGKLLRDRFGNFNNGNIQYSKMISPDVKNNSNLAFTVRAQDGLSIGGDLESISNSMHIMSKLGINNASHYAKLVEIAQSMYGNK